MRTAVQKSISAASTGLFVLAAICLPAEDGQADASLCDTVARNLVANCGFENSAPMADWTSNNAFDLHSDLNGETGSVVHSGIHALQIGNYDYDGPASISQQLATHAGDAYTLSFYYLNTHPAGYKQLLEITVDGTTKFVDDGATDTGNWTQKTFMFVATGNHSTIGFDAYAGSGKWLLDDIVVIANSRGTR